MRKAGKSDQAPGLRVGRWHVQPALNQISDGPTIRHLEPQVMDLLVFMTSTPGRVVSKDELIEAVWEGRFISDATLTRSVADLRRALGDAARPRTYIETIAKRGYRLIAPVSAPSTPSTAQAVAAPAARSDARRGPSLVVLPFANFGSNDDRYFCEGVTEEIINALTRIPALLVISRTSAFAAHSQGGDIADIGARLDVTHAIEGSVRRSDDRIRVTVQLIEVSRRGHVWSERFDRALSDVFVVQDEIADAIARRLELTLGAHGRRAAAPTTDMDAYSLYLEGRHHFLRGTRDSIDRARRCFSEAVKRDPDFALAHDALAEVFWYLGFYGLTAPKEVFTRGVWECVRALEIDDQLAEAHGLLAMLRKELDYDWAEVDREFARAMELNPRSPQVRLRRAISGLLPRGRTAEAVAELEQLAETDPLSIFVRWWLAVMYWVSRQPRRLREQADRMLEIDPTHPFVHLTVGMSLLVEGNTLAATAAFEKAAELGGRLPWLLGFFGLACGVGGRRDEARALRDELVAQSATAYVPPFSLAMIALGLGDLDAAFCWMDQAIDVRDPLVIPILTFPFMDPVRGDPRYHALVAKLNLTGALHQSLRN